MPIPVSLHNIGVDYGNSVTILSWLVDEGDAVTEGELILQVETSKTQEDIEAPGSGILGRIDAPAGVEWDISMPAAYILKDGEAMEALPAPDSENVETGESASPSNNRMVREGPQPAVKASPRARQTASELKVDLDQVLPHATGERITEDDVRRYVREIAEGVQLEEVAAGTVLELSPRRRAIAEHMVDSLNRSAGVTLHRDAWIEESLTRIENLAEAQINGARPGLADLIVAACSIALRDVPAMNSAFVDNGLLVYDVVNIGVAVHHEKGLVVPVIGNADTLDLATIAAKRHQLQNLVKDGSPPDVSLYPATFVVTNLGHLGVSYFTPILHRNTTGILGIGQLGHGFQPGADTLGQTLPLSLTFDHRSVDGVPAARFISVVAELLADPESWPRSWTLA